MGLIITHGGNLFGQEKMFVTFFSKEDSLPVSGVVVKFKNEKRIKVSNESGVIEKNITTLPLEIYVFSKFYKDTTVLVFNSQELFYLTPKEQNLSEIIVRIRKEGNEIISGKTHISSEAINSIPSIGGEKDILKTLQFQTGVSSSTEGSAGLNVRGGKSDQNQIFLNNVQVLGISNLFGFLSPVNPYIVQSLDFYKGNIPPNLGGRVSSVIDIKTKSIDLVEGKLEGEFGLLSIKGLYSQPILRNKVGVQIAVRRNFFSTIKNFDFVFNTKSIPDYRMNDLYVEGVWMIEKNTKAQVFYYGSFEKWILNNGLDAEFLNYQQKPKNDLFGFNVLQNRNDTFFQELTISKSKVKLNIENEIKTSSFLETFSYLNSLISNSIKYQTTFVPSEGLHFELGFEFKSIENSPYQNIYSKNDSVLFKKSMVYRLNLAILSNSASIKIGENVNFYFGNRTNIIRGKVLVEPSSNLSIHTNLGAFNIGFQKAIQNEQLLTNPGLGPNEDLWILPSDFNVSPVRSFSMFISNLLKKTERLYELQVATDLYFRKYKNNLSWLDGYSSSNFTTIKSDMEYQNLSNYFDIGMVRSFGAEMNISFQRKKVKSSIGYTLQKSIEKFPELNLGAVFYSNFDKRHKINFVTNYKISHKIWLNMAWSFSSGRPLTLPIGIFHVPIDIPNEDIKNLNRNTSKASFIFSGRNEYRMKNYHSLDISVERYIKYKFADGSFEVSINNIYNRHNPTFYTAAFNQDYKSFKISSIAMFPFLFSVSTKIQFR